MGAAVCVVFSETSAEPSAIRRTRRALEAAGEQVFDCGQGSLFDARLAALRGPLWFVRAGTWPARRFTASCERFPPPSATQRAVCALGAVVPELGDVNPSIEVREWSAALHASGGDFSVALARRRAVLPALASVYVDDELRARILPLLAAGLTLSQCLLELASRTKLRLLRYAALDVHASERLRVAQVVTSLQRGGAERIALDLSSELAGCGLSRASTRSIHPREVPSRRRSARSSSPSVCRRGRIEMRASTCSPPSSLPTGRM